MKNRERRIKNPSGAVRAIAKHVLVSVIIAGWLFSPYQDLLYRLGIYVFAPQPTLAAAGSFAVYQEATGGDAITTAVNNVTWDTTTVIGAGFTQQVNNYDIRLAETGHYLVMYNVGFSSTSGTSRSEIQARIDVNGTDQPVGRSTCYIRRTGGVDDCGLEGSAIIETSGVNQDVRIEVYRTDNNTAGVQLDGGSIQLLRLEDTWAYGRYSEAGGGQSITSATFASVNLDTNNEQDVGFSRTGDTVTITNAGNYLVTYNVHMVNTSGGQRGNGFRLTLGGTEVAGSRTSSYYAGGDSTDDHVASWAGIINATASDTLVLEGRCNATNCGSTATSGGAVGITIAALPSGAEYIRLHEAGGGQAVDATDDPILWDTEDEEDLGSFSHSTVTNTSRINIDTNGNYLFFGSFYMDRSPFTIDSRLQPSWVWRADGSSTYGYGGFSKYNRGFQAGGGAASSGASGGIIMYDLDDTQYIELLNTDISTGTDANATFPANRYAVQGVNITTLFEGSATVSSRGSQTASTLPSTTNLDIGGQFVITETGGSSRTIDSIKITETGTIDAQNNLDNIRLYYDLDTSNPYDCASESFSGFPTPTETQYGATDTDGFTSANGTSTFTPGVAPTVNTTTTLCVYTILDVGTGTAGDNIEIEITDPSSDVTVSAGTVGPGSIIPLNGTTNVDGKELRQIRYHWRNDDGSEALATSATSGTENRFLRIDDNTGYRIRLEVSNEGTLASSAEQYRLEYAELGFFSTDCSTFGGSWTDVGAVAGDWDMYDSANLTDGNDTTNIALGIGGVTDENTTFFVNNNGVKDTSSQVASITLATTEFVELEYSVQALTAATNGAMYCFRVTDAGTALDAYDVYPSVVLSTTNDFFVQRGFTTIASGNTNAVITAGVDYFPPASASSSFIRITNTSNTGAGENTDDDTADNANTVMAYVFNGNNLLTSVSFNRANSTDDTRIAWEIVEYTGPVGGVNEFIVRGSATTAYGSIATTTSQPVGGVVDGNDMVPWITGQGNLAGNTNEYHTGLSTAVWDGANNEIDFTRGTAGGNGNIVSWAGVEFTGSNWVIQRLEHTYTLAGSTETETPATNFGSTGRVFIHPQKRVSANSGSDEFGHEVWVSATSAVSFQLQAGATTPANHVSVAWAIENTQSTGTPLIVTRSNGTITSGGTEPRANNINVGKTLGDPSISSVLVNNRSAGTGDTYPDPMISARLISTSQYELWVSETGNAKNYRTETVEWPTALQVYAQNYYRFYVDNNGVNPTDPWPQGVADLAENTSIGQSDDPPANAERVRIRMSLQMSGQVLSANERQFKLQFGQRITTCSAIAGGSWSDVGGIGSGSTWRGYNGSPADGTTVNRVLSVSDINETYEEANNSATNPNLIDITQDGEWDWLVENNSATPATTWCFRMVQSDGATFDNYNNYPTITTSDFRPESRNWRWYDDETNETPTSALAGENVAPSNLAYNNKVKLRLTIAETGGLGATNIKFRLQFSEFSDFSAGIVNVVDITSCTEGSSLWCYADGTDVDDDPILTRVLTDSTASGVHNEDGTTASAFDPVADTATEYEFTIRHAGARQDTIYFFRAYDQTNGSPVPADSGETYPSIVVEGSRATLTVAGVTASTVTEGITTDVTTTATTVPFGFLDYEAEYEAAQTLTIDTNATEGYQVFIFEDQQMTNGVGGLMDKVTGTNATPTAWSTGCTVSASSCYGYHAGDDVLQGGSTRFTANDRYAQFSTTMEEIAYNAGPANEPHDMIFKIEISLDEDDGVFTNTLTYILVPTF